MKEKTDLWAQPQVVDQVTQAFPAVVIGALLPKMQSIPDEFVKGNRWTQFAERVVLHGWDGTDPVLLKREGVDPETAWTHVTTVMRSYEPKVEHKIAGMGYLLSLWFKDVLPASQLASADDANGAQEK